MSNYLEVARIGKNEWWRYLISFPAVLVIWLIVGSIPVILLMTYVSIDADPATSFSGAGFAGVPVVLEFLITVSSFIPLLMATLLAIRFIHARPLKTLVTGESQIRWRRIFAGIDSRFPIAGLRC